MTVGELISELEQFDEDTEVVIGMIQRYGSNFAMDICNGIAEHNISAFYGSDYNAIVITEGSQIGTVNYSDDEEDDY